MSEMGPTRHSLDFCYVQGNPRVSLFRERLCVVLCGPAAHVIHGSVAALVNQLFYMMALFASVAFHLQGLIVRA